VTGRLTAVSFFLRDAAMRWGIAEKSSPVLYRRPFSRRAVWYISRLVLMEEFA